MKFLVYLLLIYFGIGICIPGCDFSQISRLDDLWEHYKLHQEEDLDLDSDLSFVEFLYIHFIELDKHQHPNENEHQDLPLYSNSIAIILFFEPIINTLEYIIGTSKKRKISFRNIFYINPFINQIFKPPIFIR